MRGWVKVAPDEGAAAGLAGAMEWWIGADCYVVTEARTHGGTVVGKLEGIETREQALGLRGQAVAVRREMLPDPGAGRYYIADLLGLSVVNEQGTPLGEVKRSYYTGVHDVVEVVGDRTRLIPWVAAVVKEVDLHARRVLVEWGADW